MHVLKQSVNLNLSEALKNANSDIKEILLKALNNEKISVKEAYILMEATIEDLPSIFFVANLLKNRFKGKKISFSKKVFIPLTNLCRNACKYCGFRKNPSDPNSGFLSPNQVLKIAKQGKKAGCNEALFTLGEKPEEKYSEAKNQLKKLGFSTTIEYLWEMCKLVLEKTGLLPHTNPGILTMDELKLLREVNVSMGLMLENVSERLCWKGGPHEFSPGKNPKLRLKTIMDAGKLKIAFTTGILLGIGETEKEIIDSLDILRKIHENYGHIQEIIIQPFKAKKGTLMENHPEPSLKKLLQTIAVARIFLGRMNLQVPPNLTKQYLEVLPYSGINDWGGVSPVTLDYINPEESWPKIVELKNVTENCGFILKERLPIYPEYVSQKPEFIPESLKNLVFEKVDEEGYVKNGKV